MEGTSTCRRPTKEVDLETPDTRLARARGKIRRAILPWPVRSFNLEQQPCSTQQDVQFNAALMRSDKALLELAGILEATRSGWQTKARDGYVTPVPVCTAVCSLVRHGPRRRCHGGVLALRGSLSACVPPRRRFALRRGGMSHCTEKHDEEQVKKQKIGNQEGY